MRIRVSASSDANGSSSSRTPGSRARARASDVRWAMPPDTSRGRCPANAVKPTTSSSRATRWAPSSPEVPGGRPMATLAARVRHGSSRGSWKANAHRASIPAIGVPSMRTAPKVGLSSPAAIRSRVDFPQPLVPRMPTTSPGATEIVMSRMTWWSDVGLSVRVPRSLRCTLVGACERAPDAAELDAELGVGPATDGPGRGVPTGPLMWGCGGPTLGRGSE